MTGSITSWRRTPTPIISRGFPTRQKTSKSKPRFLVDTCDFKTKTSPRFIRYWKNAANSLPSSSGRGDVLNFGGVKVEVLDPVSDSSPEEASDNNQFDCPENNFRREKLLLTGDIEREAESALSAKPGIIYARMS